MTEKSYLWDGIAVGDATLAPYDKTEFNKFSHLQIITDGTEGYVIPAYLNDLKVTPAGSSLSAVQVDTGAALLNNYVYVLDQAVTLPITRPTDGYWRVDLIILQLVLDQTDPMYQTCRVIVLQGLESAVGTIPTEPALTQSATLWQVALSRITVTDPTTYTYILDFYTHDSRKFVYTDKSVKLYDGSYNLVANGEFMAVSVRGGVDAPDLWYSTPTGARTVVTKLPPMVRGNAINCTVSGLNFYQYIPVNKTQTTYTIKVLFKLGQTTDGLNVYLQPYDSAGNLIDTNQIHQVFDTEVVGNVITYQETITFDTTNLAFLRVMYETAGANPTDITFGQVIVVPGYHPGPFREFHEIIPLEYPLTDASFTTTPKSTSTVTVNLTTNFNGYVPLWTRAVLLRCEANDSNSLATASVYVRVQGYAAPFNTIYSTLELGGVPDDYKREIQLIVPVWEPQWYVPNAIHQFRVDMVASGVNTLDVLLEVVGLIT